jgi:hypothetical protein
MGRMEYVHEIEVQTSVIKLYYFKSEIYSH